MEKVLIIFSLLLGASLGQSIECVYEEWNNEGVEHYICNLMIENPDGFDNFTSIAGTHLPNRTDADVTRVYRNSPAISSIFPRILCSQFPNLLEINLFYIRLKYIHENSLSDCVNLRELNIMRNTIEDIHENAFAYNNKLKFLYMEQSNITSLPENVFDPLVNLEILDISLNPFETIPGGLFKGLINLDILYIEAINVNALNPEWFENFQNLGAISMRNNNFTSISEDVFSQLENLWGLEISRIPLGNNIASGAFKNLKNLRILYMMVNEITELNLAWFETLTNLEELYISGNLLTSIPEKAFDNFSNLTYLDIGSNRLEGSNIPGNTFDKLPRLSTLIMSYNPLGNLNSQWFQNLTELTFLSLTHNQISDLPLEVFTPISSLDIIDLTSNKLEIISRNSFGNISNLQNVIFARNLISAIDEKFLKEAYALTRLDLQGNLCTSSFFYNFSMNQEYNIAYLSGCTRNFDYIVETATDYGSPYNFFSAPKSGIQIRVNTDEEVHISLTPFKFLWRPIVEIVIGTRNNTVSTIIRNQDQEVAVARSPNIIRPGQWTRLRITWTHDLILVTRDGQDLPFLGYNMQDIFPVQYFGIRSPKSNAVWRIQPATW